MRHQAAGFIPRVSWVSMVVRGLLIHTLAGRAGASGRRPRNRSGRAAKVPGKTGQYLRVLNAASEKGLSLETCGREWLRVMFRSVSRVATFLEVIEVPLSAWM